jgi:hypothetical protein
MIGLMIMLISLLAGLSTWLFGIRPYLVQRGITVITAAKWGVSAWSDWQQCSDFARKTHDSKASLLAKMFLFAQISFVVGLIALLCGV